jgi:hypothetical protein
VPLADPKIRRSGKELAALKRAERARRSRAAWRAVSIVGGLSLFAGLALLAVLGIIWGTQGALIGLLLTMPGLGLLLGGLSKSKSREKEIPPALDEAWLAMATDVAEQSTGNLTARRLATALCIEESQAEELLALLEAHEIVRSEIGRAGEANYRPRLRVAPQPDRDIQAEQEALQAEAEAMEAAKRQRSEP